MGDYTVPLFQETPKNDWRKLIKGFSLGFSVSLLIGFACVGVWHQVSNDNAMDMAALPSMRGNVGGMHPMPMKTHHIGLSAPIAPLHQNACGGGARSPLRSQPG